MIHAIPLEPGPSGLPLLNTAKTSFKNYQEELRQSVHERFQMVSLIFDALLLQKPFSNPYLRAELATRRIIIAGECIIQQNAINTLFSKKEIRSFTSLFNQQVIPSLNRAVSDFRL